MDKTICGACEKVVGKHFKWGTYTNFTNVEVRSKFHVTCDVSQMTTPERIMEQKDKAIVLHNHQEFKRQELELRKKEYQEYNQKLNEKRIKNMKYDGCMREVLKTMPEYIQSKKALEEINGELKYLSDENTYISQDILQILGMTLSYDDNDEDDKYYIDESVPANETTVEECKNLHEQLIKQSSRISEIRQSMVHVRIKQRKVQMMYNVQHDELLRKVQSRLNET
jgi:hypothetical protein